MKFLIVMFLNVFSLSVFASDYAANWIECWNPDSKIRLSYTPTLKGTKVRIFNYTKGAGREINTDEINKTETALGSVLTVGDHQLSVPDLQRATVSLILPDINIISFRSNGLPISFETMVVETISKTSIAGPSLIHGVIQNSEYFSVKCTAEIR